jgi:hypothetical protein
MLHQPAQSVFLFIFGNAELLGFEALLNLTWSEENTAKGINVVWEQG